MSKPPNVPRYYWDACVFIAGIASEPGRIEVVAQLLEDAAAGRCLIATSSLTITEVAFGVGEKEAQRGDPAKEAAIDALWNTTSPVKLVEVDTLIAAEARRLIRDARFNSGHSLRPPDAIHLATAMRFGVTEVHTYDDWQRFSVLTGQTIREPAVAQGTLFAATMIGAAGRGQSGS